MYPKSWTLSPKLEILNPITGLPYHHQRDAGGRVLAYTNPQALNPNPNPETRSSSGNTS